MVHQEDRTIGLMNTPKDGSVLAQATRLFRLKVGEPEEKEAVCEELKPSNLLMCHVPP